MDVLVVADTHLASSASARGLPPAIVTAAARADLVLHAGDITSAWVLDALGQHAPVIAVRGNNDTTPDVAGLPETATLDLDGWTVVMVHDSGPAKGRAARLHRWFPGADAVVFGHSHIPWDAVGVGGQRLCNPGSATQRRRQPHRTFGWLSTAPSRLAWRIEVVG